MLENIDNLKVDYMTSNDISIIMYFPYFLPEYGGAELATLNLAKELKTFCDVKIYTFNYRVNRRDYIKYGFNMSDEYPEFEYYDNVEIFRFPITFLPIIKNFSLNLLFHLKKADADIIHFQGTPRLFGRLLIQYIFNNRKTVLTTHGFIESLKLMNQNRFKSLIYLFLRKSFLKLDHVIALSNVDIALLKKMGVEKEKITLIPNGIDVFKFKNRKKFLEKNDKKKILCVARFAENKNYEALINALVKLKRDMDFQAIFVGAITDKNYYKKIVHMIKEYDLVQNIRIETSLEDAYLVDCYLSCDLFVLPSKMETFPLVILEAMYAGLPVISTPVGGIPGIIRNGINGFLVPPNDHEALFNKCLQILNDENMRRGMGEKNKIDSKKYTWKNSAISTYNLYMKILSRI